MPRTKLPKGSVPVTFRLPSQVRRILTDKAQREAISVSELIRRALRREIKAARDHERLK
ncbi:MAG TPA: ribbon-helix-helix protein, CopG family [Chthoniobacterales bacterium]|nr:ribbon-helix-helix protein, CopG family [Chthoniobacterales bacterium]